ncbi:MAG: UDP-N-acetylmuramoyl-L-alanyl-D-glutamate--2,6-diaminopimelate ligase [Candidatus Margulisiibacteriota bacterium]
MMLDKSKTYCYDSRRITPGDSFICLPKGERFIEDALNRGAHGVIHMTRQEFAENANAYFDYPTERVALVGITGTNGKTSVSYFTAQLLEALGRKVLVIGTINSKLTTPESWDVLARIRQHVDQGGTHVVMEVSSHGIDQGRVHGFDFNVKCLTNITHDHLDYHKTFENYKMTKMKFMQDYNGQSVFSDDLSLIDSREVPHLPGQFHLKNITSALAICQGLGLDRSMLMPHLKSLTPPKGRFESIALGQPFRVIIDFAHTPDALATVLDDALKCVDGKKDKLRVVFGCGGNRDHQKRPKMGAIAERFSRHIYLTADNSRTETTQNIINDIKSGIINLDCVRVANVDRQQAIAAAIRDANYGDMIIIAGKGHELDQVGAAFSYYFNDGSIAAYEIIKQRTFQTNLSWVLNEPDANADVLFISKKVMNELKITQSNFRRSLPTPSMAKVKDYFSKIKGDKILVLESGDRFSLVGLLTHVLMNCGGARVIEFGDQSTLEHDLVGLTLFEQTELPIIIKIDPKKIQKLSRASEVITPDHIVLGDIYHPNEYVEPHIQKMILNLFQGNKTLYSFWCSEKMSDIVDPLNEIGAQQCHFIKSLNWLDYNIEVVKEVLIKCEMYHDDVIQLYQDYLRASGWFHKLTFNNGPGQAYIVNLTQDPLDLKQKISFFNQNKSPVIHHVFPSKNSDVLKYEINETLGQSSEIQVKEYIKGALQDQFKNDVAAVNEAIHIIWSEVQSLTEIEAVL